MNDYIAIWNNFFDIVKAMWNFVFTYQGGIIGALIIIMMMLVVLKMILFGNRDDK